jgi:hypothetical protein
MPEAVPMPDSAPTTVTTATLPPSAAPPARQVLPRWGSLLAALLGVLLVLAAFGLAATRAVELDFHNRVPFWVLDAIPPAISELYYGNQKRYTSFESVQRRFFNRVDRESSTARTVNAAMRRLEETNNEDPGTAILLMGPDDKGIVDLTELSFRLFGLRLESVITLYFAILLASCLLYILAFRRSPSALLLLASFLAMLYLIMPMVAFNPQLRSLLALRAFPILAMVACLHCLLFMASSLRERVIVLQIVLVAAQALLIAFCIHLRSTTIWEVATIVGFGVVVLAVSVVRRVDLTPQPPLRRGEREKPASFSPSPRRRGGWGVRSPGRSGLLAIGATLGLVIAGYLGLQVYQATALPDEYRRGDEIATRNFWHNIYTGFAYHPAMRERYQLRLDDVSIEAATRDWLIESGRLDDWLAIGGRPPAPPGTVESASAFEGVKLAKYDPLVRDMLIARCSIYTRECLETVLYYKPVSLLENLAWLYGVRDLPPDLEVATSHYFGEQGDLLKRQFIGTSQRLDSTGLRPSLWNPRVLLVIVPFVVLLLVESAERARATFAAGAWLVLGSTIPAEVGYAAPHTIGEPGIAFGMLIYLGLGLAIVAGLRRVLAARVRRSASRL